MKGLPIIICLALTILAPGQSAYAKPIATRGSALTQDTRTFHHSEAGIQFELPKGWKAKPEGDVITVSTEDDSLQMVFWVPDEESLDAAVKALDKEIEKTVKNMKTIGKPTEDTHNGMSHFSENGTGEVNGTTIEWSVDVLGAKKVVVILTFAAPELRQNHADEAAKFISSIKKMP